MPIRLFAPSVSVSSVCGSRSTRRYTSRPPISTTSPVAATIPCVYSLLHLNTTDYQDAKARLETVKALPNLLADEDHVSRVSTDLLRLTPRLIEMAIRDVDVAVRVHAINMVTAIEQAGILEDEEDEQMAQVAHLIFDSDPRVRKAAAPFIHGLWTHKVDELKTEWTGLKGIKKKRSGKTSEEEMERWLGYKALSSVLTDIAESFEQAEEDSASTWHISSVPKSLRPKYAVQALLEYFEELQEWNNLLDYLHLDHADGEDLWLLKEDEETVLLQALLTCVEESNKVNLRSTTPMAHTNLRTIMKKKGMSIPKCS